MALVNTREYLHRKEAISTTDELSVQSGDTLSAGLGGNFDNLVQGRLPKSFQLCRSCYWDG